jgi:SAM-dependent methyltransferase
VLFRDYFYFSSSIGTLVEHFQKFAHEISRRFLINKKDASIFEIGCNDGALLSPFAEMGILSVGVDPATNVVNSIKNNEINVINDYFTDRLAESIEAKHGRFDAILSSYSFAHIDNMFDVMKGIKRLLKEDGVFVFEVYYLGTLIEEMQYDMIYHEHMSYYSLKTLMLFLNKFDMEIFDIKYTPGVRSGAVRFYAQNIYKGKEEQTQELKNMIKYEEEKGFDRVEVFMEYSQKVNETRDQILELLISLKNDGKKIIGYGASGRGTTIMNYCGIDEQYLDYVVDDAPAKHGYYTPGTHVPIMPWDYTKEAGPPDYALLFAWSFIDEVKKRRAEYLKRGGKFIVPLPQVTVVSA